MILTTLSYDLATLDCSRFTEICHTLSRLMPLVMLLLLPKSFLTLAPTEVLSWVFLKHFHSYRCYRAYYNALW